jgi:hypothetical protein
VQDISPEAVRTGKYRFLRTAPVIFSPIDPHVLYFAGNVLFKTTTGGNSWEVISPDLSREKPEVPQSIGIYRTPELADQPRRGVIYTVAPSYRDVRTIWAGTDDGLIHVTRDGGKNWKNVTPPSLTAWSKVSIIDAGRFDADTAYAAINRIRLDDQRPHILRTHDGGQSWKEIVHGLPDNAPVNTIREDPVRRGLLFAGTERAVFVSSNDGDDWQPLRRNMPATSIRDLVVHDDDLVVGTHGRSFWILDNITPLRQWHENTAREDVVLFKPQQAYRVRWSVNTDTPLPPEEPAGKNPPDGAMIDYFLKDAATGAVTLEVLDEQHKLVRRYSSKDQPEAVDEQNLAIPTYWIRPAHILPTSAGAHRFIWDLHYPAPPGQARDYPMTAIFRDTPSEPLGPWVPPGKYTVRLAVAGKHHEQELVVRMDPRVSISREALAQQSKLSMDAYDGIIKTHAALTDVRKLLESVRATAKEAPPKPIAEELKSLEEKLAHLAGAAPQGRRQFRRGRSAEHVDLSTLNATCLSLMQLLQSADSPPTTQAVDACVKTRQRLTEILGQWEQIKTVELPEINRHLREANLAAVGF